jgi:sortase A
VTPRRAAAWLRILEIVLLIAGASALGWYGLAQGAAARDQAALSRELELYSARAASAAASADRRSQKRPRTLAIGALVGRVEVPRLDISAIAREGADARTLRSAVGHVPSTALPGDRGNAAFAGHRDSFFRGLRGIRAGDRIIVTTEDGRHDYVVRETRVVKPTDVSVLDPTPEPTLTLVTCYPFSYIGPAPNRFIVRATLTERAAD